LNFTGHLFGPIVLYGHLKYDLLVVSVLVADIWCINFIDNLLSACVLYFNRYLIDSLLKMFLLTAAIIQLHLLHLRIRFLIFKCKISNLIFFFIILNGKNLVIWSNWHFFRDLNTCLAIDRILNIFDRLSLYYGFFLDDNFNGNFPNPLKRDFSCFLKDNLSRNLYKPIFVDNNLYGNF
jgi:hypothetical protein